MASVASSAHPRVDLPIMRLLRPTRGLLRVLVVFLWFLLHQAAVHGDDESSWDAASELPDDHLPVHVDDYLETLSNEELRRICSDRGFDIVVTDPGSPDAAGATAAASVPLSRAQLLEGARRCLSLEDEMNAILAEHPELAAELDREIERMRRQKQVLEQEREEILAQKALLERQLAEAGVDVGPSRDAAAAGTGAVEPSPTHPVVPDTLEGVLRESFRELYARVLQDVRLVQTVLRPVTEQVDRVWQLVWRYMQPLLGRAYSKARRELEGLQQRRRQQQQQPEQQRALPAHS